MRQSFQMEQPVDKEKQDELVSFHTVPGSLFRRFCKADKNFSAAAASLIGEDVWNV